MSRSTREQRAWFWYDWANSGYVTTTATVLIGPYLNAIARSDACPGLPSAEVCRATVQLFGLSISPGSLASYVVTFSTLFSAFFLILVGAIADRARRPHLLMGGFAWVGAAAAASMVLLQGSNWRLGVVLVFIATVCLGSSLVIYDAILIRITPADDRDRVSSRGWAMGYLGGGLLLALNFGLLTLGPSLGLTTSTAVRICLLSAGLWWGVFAIIPVLGLRRLPSTLPAVRAEPWGRRITLAARQLGDTFADLRRYPQTLLFLVAYLFYNDGMQTVIGSSSIFGISELGMAENNVMMVFLVVQFVALGGALLFGAIAQRVGASRTVLASLAVWLLVVVSAYFVPRGSLSGFMMLGCAIGLVLGGTQALSRSLYSQLVPRGRESEYFSLYQAMERGTSWLGTLAFGLLYQFTHSYRTAVAALVVFFVVGGVLLSRVRFKEGVEAAGNPVPTRL